jgi:hypothetical protein
MKVRIVECGCCGQFHRTDFFGDCRNDEERFPSEEEAAARLGVKTLEVERFEYDEGEVSEHFVESWPDCRFVKALPVD